LRNQRLSPESGSDASLLPTDDEIEIDTKIEPNKNDNNFDMDAMMK